MRTAAAIALLVVAAAGAAAAERPAPPAGWTIADPGQGPFDLPRGETHARELSGIAWAGGTRYYAVSDKLGTLFPLSIEVNRDSGRIVAARVEPGLRLLGSIDLEGVVYDGAHATLLVSDEAGPAIREYRVADGRQVAAIRLPGVYTSARKNLSLESLALDEARHMLWTVNEETLRRDGPVGDATTGSVVRLQRFTDSRPSGQWAYNVDPLPSGDVLMPGRDVESSGVSDLVALPDGGLLALERAYGQGGLRTRIYEIDLSRATDVSRVSSLSGRDFVAAEKRLLWEKRFPDINCEGAALGPTLSDGGRSLILISDDGHRQRQVLYPLVVRRAPALVTPRAAAVTPQHTGGR